MKAKSLIFALATACVLPGMTANLAAAGYNKAAFTRLQNQVNVLKGDANPTPASVGQEITNVTSVATGPDSRAELQFPDKSLTRIGANSRFTLKGDGRTLDLDSGVMMLQVPKKMGGAKVRTAAVTAAVTGNYILVEVMKNGLIKLICVEGSVDLFLNTNPSQFTTLNAGQMIIMKSDGSSIPQPVDIDLATLLKSSKLISGDDWGPNKQQINQAMQEQQEQIQSGNLVVTNLAIEGRGTLVSLNNNAAYNAANFTVRETTPPASQTGGTQGTGNPGATGTPTTPGGTTPPPATTPPPPTTPFQGFAPLISGKTILNRTATIETNPHVEAYNVQAGEVVRSEGLVYNPATMGYTFEYFTFGNTQPANATLQQVFAFPTNKWGWDNSGNWSVFRFQDLVINGSPEIYIGTPPPDEGEGEISSFGSFSEEGPSETPPIRDIVLASDNGIRIGAASFYPGEVPAEAGGQLYPWGWGTTTMDLRYTGLENVALVANVGDIIVKSGYGHYAIRGYNQNVTLAAVGLQNDVLLEGNILLESGGGYYWWQPDTAKLTVIAGRDVIVNWVTIAADKVNFEAGQNINISSGHIQAKKRAVTMTAKKSINITNSSTLKALSYWSPDSLVRLEAQEGDVNVTNSYIQAKNIELQANLGHINLVGATTSGDVFKATTMGPDGRINISGNSSISANTLIQLYAEGANGGVFFIDGQTVLNSSLVKIAGKTVSIDPAASVKLTKPGAGLKVYTDNAVFNGQGGGGNFLNSSDGVFVPEAPIDNPTSTVGKPFSSRGE